MVKPIGHSGETFTCRQVIQPARILGTPHQSMELVGEAVLFGIVESIVCSTPVEVATATFHRRPFRLVLTGNLVPQLIKLWHATSCIHIITGCDIAQKLIGITGQLGVGTDGHDAHE